MTPEPLIPKIVSSVAAPTVDSPGRAALREQTKEIVEFLRTKLYGVFVGNREAAFDAALDMIEKSGRQIKEGVPLRLMVPLLQGMSNEDCPELQGRWAALMAHASTADDPNDFPPMFVYTLSQLTPFAALVLDAFAAATELEAVGVAPGLERRWGVSVAEVAQRMGENDTARVAFAADMLARESLLEREPTGAAQLRPSGYGRRFLRHVARPRRGE